MCEELVHRWDNHIQREGQKRNSGLQVRRALTNYQCMAVDPYGGLYYLGGSWSI